MSFYHDDLLFGPIDIDDYNNNNNPNLDSSPPQSSPSFWPNAQLHPSEQLFASANSSNSLFPELDNNPAAGDYYLSHWTHHPASPTQTTTSSSSPIPIAEQSPSHYDSALPGTGSVGENAYDFVPWRDPQTYPMAMSLSPPLLSLSPPQHDASSPCLSPGALLITHPPAATESTPFPLLEPPSPAWASHLWDTPHPQRASALSATRPPHTRSRSDAAYLSRPSIVTSGTTNPAANTFDYIPRSFVSGGGPQSPNSTQVLFHPASAPTQRSGIGAMRTAAGSGSGSGSGTGAGRTRAYSQRASGGGDDTDTHGMRGGGVDDVYRRGGGDDMDAYGGQGRGDSVGPGDVAVKADPDATVRRKKVRRTSVSVDRDDRPADHATTLPSKSELRPPKLAPSTWQLYFTDWIQRHQAQGDKKLNVAQAAKEAGSEYANLTPEQKEPYKRRSLAAKEARERELAAWQRTLTPDDIKRENVFRTAQRKAGKSRRGNIKDPNAPKKPLSAYFMFLHHIRSHPELVREVFGDERETTSQSVLAAAKWRSMTDEERKPFLARAEQEKLDYEAARRLYEEGTPGFETTISFNLPSPSPFLSSSPTGPTFMFPPPPSPSSPQGAKQQHYQYQYQPQQFGQVHIEQQQQQIQQHQQGLMPPPAQSHSPHLREFSSESEVDSEGFVTDEGDDHRRRPPAVRRS